MITYSGFSTKINYKKFKVTDFELAKQDLINYFNIRRGEKLMQPKFGTIIWDMLFEPLNEDTQQVITQDITKIAQYDPRIRIGQVAVTQKDNGILVELTLAYVPTNQTEVLALTFDRNKKSVLTN